MYYSPVITALLLVCGAVTLRAKQLCLLGDFESQVQYLQDNVMLTPDEVASALRMYDDVRDTLRRRWRGAEVYPYGSLATGVALKYSDADFFAKVPNYNSKRDEPVLQELFQLQPDLYSRLYIYPLVEIGDHYTLITFYHNLTDRYCDLLFNDIRGIQSSRVFGYVIKLDERIAPLVGVIKFWTRIHQITGPKLLTNFGVYSLIIFYLQQKNMAPPIYMLQNDSKSHEFDEWDMNFEEMPYNSTNKESLYQLLGGFFKYYSEFNFKEYIVSPFLGRPIHKSEFADVNNVPDEFTLYKTYMVKKNAIPLELNTDFCIQEVFEHNQNAGQRVKGEHTLKIISHINFAAKMFKELPSDRVLRAILTKDQHNEQYVRVKEIIVDEISKLEDCINGTVP